MNPDDDLTSLSDTIKEEDLVVVLLTNQLEPQKEQIESSLRDLNANRPGIKIAEILIDNVKYDNEHITFPGDLRPIRNREDMDAAWTGIEQNLKNMFPPPVKKEPVPFDWQKFLKVAVPILLLGILLIWWSPWEGNSNTGTSTNVSAVDPSFVFQVEDVFSITGRGTVVTGRISRGAINQGDEIVITGGQEGAIQAVVSAIEISGNAIEEANAGEKVGLLLRGVNSSQIQRGMVIRKPR